MELRIADKDGSWHWVEALATNVTDEPTVGGIVFNYRVINDRKAFEQRLRHEAYHDPLTSLANRALFNESLNDCLSKGEEVGVVFIDLDNFKTVNDELGHAAGDHLLASVAERLLAVVRPEDVVARLGGDEFGIILLDTPPTRAVDVANRISAAFKPPFMLNGQKMSVSASVGVASATDGVDSEQLLQDADHAMYTAKGAGKARVELFKGERRKIDVLGPVRGPWDQPEDHPVSLLLSRPTARLRKWHKGSHCQ